MKKHSRFIKVLIAASAVAASAGVSLGITSLVSANSSTTAGVVAVTATEPGGVNTADDTESGVVVAAGTDGTVETKSIDGRKGGAHSAAMAELLGMTQEEIHEALHSGKSLATIAEEKNVALSKVTDLLISEFSAHLDEHVAAGDLTREEADTRLAAFKDNVDEMVTMTPPARGEGHRGGKGHGPKLAARSEAMAALFGMTVDELHEALHSGKSLATIAEEKNVDLSKVTDLLVAEFSAHLDEEVAAGEMTREEADAKLATFKENVDEMVTMTPPARGEGRIEGRRGGFPGELQGQGEMGPRGHRGPGGHRGHGDMNESPESLGELEGSGTAFNA